VAASDDGATLLSADEVPVPGGSEHSEPGMFVWQRNTARLVARLGDQFIDALAITPNGRLAASGDADGHIRVWDLESQTLQRTIPFADVVAIAFGRDDSRLTAVGRNGDVRIWNVVTGDVLIQRNVGRAVAIAAIASTGTRLAVARSDSGVKIHDLTGAAKPAAAATSGRVVTIAFAPGGDHFAAGDEKGSVYLFDASGKLHREIDASPGWPIRSVAMPSADQVVASTTTQGQYLTLLRDEAPLYLSRMEGPFGALALFAGGRLLLGGSFDGALHVWDLENGTEVRTTASHLGAVQWLRFTPAGDLLSHGPWPGEEGSFRRWNLGSRQSRAVPFPSAHIVAMTPDGARLGYIESIDFALLHLAAPGDETSDRTVGDVGLYEVTAGAFSPDGTHLLLGSREGKLALIDASAATIVRTSSADEGLIYAVAVSADGRLLASAGDALRVWDATTGSQYRELAKELINPTYLAFLHDGKRLLAASQRAGLQLWNLHEPGETVRTLAEGDGKRMQGSTDFVSAAAVSADDRFLVTGHGSGAIKIWDLHSGAELTAARRHADMVTAVALSADATALASADAQGLILIWPL
jgi:WD40 repeat protein